jgi:hypothetical protein
LHLRSVTLLGGRADSRLAANGKAAEAILIKQGKIIPEDISDKEVVKMGHVMQPVIGRLAQERLQIELKDADYAMTHPRESWLRSHFDFISADGTVLVEAKNYGSVISLRSLMKMLGSCLMLIASSAFMKQLFMESRPSIWQSCWVVRNSRSSK